MSLARTAIIDSTLGVISSNLVMQIDPGNTYSYSGSGVTCFNIAANPSDDNQLFNGVGFTGVDGWTSFIFDGTNDHLDVFIPNLANVCTVELWARITSFSTRMLFSWDYYSVYLSGAMGFNTGNSDLYGISSATVSSLGLLNNWKQYVFIMYADFISPTYMNNSIYVNGQYQTFNTGPGGFGMASQNINFSTERGTANSKGWGSANIGCWKNSSNTSGALFTPMRLGLFRFYNRALTSEEILQNFNSTKSRFNIA